MAAKRTMTPATIKATIGAFITELPEDVALAGGKRGADGVLGGSGGIEGGAEGAGGGGEGGGGEGSGAKGGRGGGGATARGTET